jgi:hypothetical protein
VSFIRSSKFLFLVWLVVSAVSLGGTGLAMRANLEQSPTRITVIVDSSFEAGKDWDFIKSELEVVGERSYARFRVLTEKTLNGDWMEEVTLNSVTPFAPRDWANVVSTLPSLIKTSDEVILITNTMKLPKPILLTGITIIVPQ